ncbi:hypothetical protein OM948_08705 [Xanthomonas citri pv. fuscans]|uniref:hypothetical protein n=1 Tax=Xanthomonas citri TaxID=346 RepID=UPI00222699FC|nr:hypothetical protein [Xanthomonas citri]UZB05991.1 hypothetical protein OM948_08705 [Xanthomonas citri pv. fuscans]
MQSVAVLFARADSVYKTLPGCDVYDIDRDARTFGGGMPVVAHPPCRGWGKLRAFARPVPGELELGPWAVEQVRSWGGVLEHPVGSALWTAADLPPPGMFWDAWGGFTICVNQRDWGHRAEKATLLYIVGCGIGDLPAMPARAVGRATHVINSCMRGTDGRLLRKGHPDWRPECSKAEREHTPQALAQWLVEVARRCAANRMQEAA